MLVHPNKLSYTTECKDCPLLMCLDPEEATATHSSTSPQEFLKGSKHKPSRQSCCVGLSRPLLWRQPAAPAYQDAWHVTSDTATTRASAAISAAPYGCAASSCEPWCCGHRVCGHTPPTG